MQLPFKSLPSKALAKEVRPDCIAAEVAQIIRPCNAKRNIKQDNEQERMNLSIGNGILEGAETLRSADVSEGRREAGSLLAHVLGHFLRHDPCCHVNGARSRQRHDHLDGPLGIGGLRHGIGARQRKYSEKREHGFHDNCSA